MNNLQQKQLVTLLGELTGKPNTSKLHVHPTTWESSELGDEVTVIDSQEIAYNTQFMVAGRSWLVQDGILTLVSRELQLTIPCLNCIVYQSLGVILCGPADMKFFDRLSEKYQKLLESLIAYHSGARLKLHATDKQTQLRTDRESPDNQGLELDSVHPVVRTNPVTGWKSVFLTNNFTQYINQLKVDESSDIFMPLFKQPWSKMVALMSLGKNTPDFWKIKDPDESKNPRTATSSELHYLNENQLLFLPRDSDRGYTQPNLTSIFRYIDIVDINHSTNLANKPIYDNSTGTVAPDGEILLQGIVAGTTYSFIDFNIESELQKIGLHNGAPDLPTDLDEKWESIAIAPANTGKNDYFIFSMSDNDFITQNGSLNGQPYVDNSGNNVPTQVLVFWVTLEGLDMGNQLVTLRDS